jgi:hypothetical protein
VDDGSAITSFYIILPYISSKEEIPFYITAAHINKAIEEILENPVWHAEDIKHLRKLGFDVPDVPVDPEPHDDLGASNVPFETDDQYLENYQW